MDDLAWEEDDGAARAADDADGAARAADAADGAARAADAAADSADGDARTERHQFEYPVDALAALDVDRKHRQDHPDGPGGDLWTIDQIAKAPRPGFSCAYPTVAPELWDCSAANARISSKEYVDAFASEFPEIAAMLADCGGLVIGGGAAAWPLGDRAKRPADVDVFVVDCAPDTPMPELWRRVATAVNHLTRQATRDGGVVRQVAVPGLVTVFIDYAGDQSDRGHSIDSERRVKVQFVLRAYRSVTALLHAVDGIVPTAFDGKTVYTTSLGAFEHAHGTIVVDTDLRSISYERRLHNYFARNYALQFPHLKQATFAAGQELNLGHVGIVAPAPLTIKFADGGPRGRLAFGTVSAPSDSRSDYDDPTVAIVELSNRSRHLRSMVERFINRTSANHRIMPQIVQLIPTAEIGEAQTLELIRKIVSLVPPTSCTIALSLKLDTDVDKAFALGDGVGRAGALALDEWAEHGAPSLGHLVEREHLCAELENRMKGICRNFGHLKLQEICDVFKVDRDTLREIASEAATVVAAAADAAASAETIVAAESKIRKNLNKAAASLLQWFDRAANLPVAWWVTIEPGRQWTAAYNPRAVAAADWYGDAFEPTPERATAADDLAALTLAAARRPAPLAGATYGTDCVLCMRRVRRGDLNTCTLPCGHVFHWTDPPRCGGLLAWTKKSCPVCRQ